eukprot:SAG11_NODE_6790_length_1248_cov_1.752829_3_plen_101_part_00
MCLQHGSLLMSGASDNTVRLWDPEGGRCVKVLSGHTSRVWSVASDAAGRRIASASGDGLVKLWDVGGGEVDDVVTVQRPVRACASRCRCFPISTQCAPKS